MNNSRFFVGKGIWNSSIPLSHLPVSKEHAYWFLLFIYLKNPDNLFRKLANPLPVESSGMTDCKKTDISSTHCLQNLNFHFFLYDNLHDCLYFCFSHKLASFYPAQPKSCHLDPIYFTHRLVNSPQYSNTLHKEVSLNFSRILIIIILFYFFKREKGDKTVNKIKNKNF